MRTYNGYTGDERLMSYRWFKRQLERGLRPPLDLSACSACGDTTSLIQPHSEDYSSPALSGEHHSSGARVGEHVFCWRCHMMLHTRFSMPDAFADYLRKIGEGWLFRPCLNSKGYFSEISGYYRCNVQPVRMGPDRGRTVLHQIIAGEDPVGINRVHIV